MFEFKTANQSIPQFQLLSFFLVCFVIYLLFMKKISLSYFSIIILIIFNQALVQLVDSQARSTKLLLIALPLWFLLRGKTVRQDRHDSLVFIFFLLFSVLHFFQYLYYNVPITWATAHYLKFVIPVLLYFSLRRVVAKGIDTDFYASFIIKMFWFQIGFSIVKIILIGIREDVIGTVSLTGGSIAVTFPILGLVIYWLYKRGNIKGKDVVFILLLLIIAVASNKRAIWIMYPMILISLYTYKMQAQTFRKIGIIFIAAPLILYFGLRINPTLNPEGKLWGSFDPAYAMDYTLSYSGVSEEKYGTGQGRWGATLGVLTNILTRPFGEQSLLGFSKTRSGRADYAEFNPLDYGFQAQTGISGLGVGMIRMGYPAFLFLILVYTNMITTIKTKSVRNALLVFFLWDVIFYSGVLLFSYIQTVMLVITIIIAESYEKSIKSGASGIIQDN